MSSGWNVRHMRGFERFPATAGGGTIPSADAKPDDLNDLIAAKLRFLWHAQQSADGWSGECERHRRDVDRICELNGYVGLSVDPRDYLVHIVGQSLLYDVPADKRGHLAPFAGKRIRLVCTYSGAFRRFVWIGVVGVARRRKRPTSPMLLRNADTPPSQAGLAHATEPTRASSIAASVDWGLEQDRCRPMEDPLATDPMDWARAFLSSGDSRDAERTYQWFRNAMYAAAPDAPQREDHCWDDIPTHPHGRPPRR